MVTGFAIGVVCCGLGIMDGDLKLLGAGAVVIAAYVLVRYCP